MSPILSGLILALSAATVAVLGFLAYRDIERYRKLFVPLFTAIILLFTGMAIWNASNYVAFAAALPFLDAQTAAEIRTVIAAHQFPRWVWPLYRGALAYIVFLAYLPGKSRRRARGKDGPPER